MLTGRLVVGLALLLSIPCAHACIDEGGFASFGPAGGYTVEAADCPSHAAQGHCLDGGHQYPSIIRDFCELSCGLCPSPNFPPNSPPARPPSPPPPSSPPVPPPSPPPFPPSPPTSPPPPPPAPPNIIVHVDHQGNGLPPDDVASHVDLWSARDYTLTYVSSTAEIAAGNIAYWVPTKGVLGQFWAIGRFWAIGQFCLSPPLMMRW
jgi:hypothetical protein